MATCVQHMLKINKNFTLQHLCYPIEHIYLCLTSIYHILLKLSCPYSWLIKQTKQTTTKTTIKKTIESSVCRPWRGCWQLHWEYKNQPCLCIEILGNFYLIYSCLLNCLFTLKQHLFSTIQLKFFFFKSNICWWKNFSFFPTGFLRKVYGILTAQLMLTIFVAGVFMYTESIKTFVQGRYCVENL